MAEEEMRDKKVKNEARNDNSSQEPFVSGKVHEFFHFTHSLLHAPPSQGLEGG